MDIFLEVFNVSGEGISWLFCTRNWGLTWFNQGQMIQLYNGDKSGYLTRISRGYNQKKHDFGMSENLIWTPKFMPSWSGKPGDKSRWFNGD